MKAAILVLSLVAASPQTMADPYGHRDRYLSVDRRDYAYPFYRHFDPPGLSHRHHYYRPGYRIRQLPARHHHFVHRGRDYYYFGGNFFLHPGGYYEVIYPPYGARVPYLPPGYVTFHLGPRRYFYLNATYYLWDHERKDYIVVREPEGAETAIVEAAQGYSSEIYAYPAQGQSAEQQDRDYYDCHLWSVEESGYDPTLEGQNVYRFRDYRRAMIACLEGRGYSVR